LTFANVVACLALFVALGGVSYAALQLPKNSVGSKQLKKKAVTPAKLSPSTKRALAGAPGSIGPAGPQGKEGPRGSQGPGAVTIDAPVPETTTVIATFDGVEVSAICEPTSIGIALLASSGTLQVSGTSNNYNTPGTPKVEPVDVAGASGYGVTGAASPYEVSLNVIARAPAVSKAFGRFDLHLDAAHCELWGMHTPST
jgi:hypothetical protein